MLLGRCAHGVAASSATSDVERKLLSAQAPQAAEAPPEARGRRREAQPQAPKRCPRSCAPEGAVEAARAQ